MATKPHAVLIPYPIQGHVIPMLELGHQLATHGIKVSFVNTESNHRRMMESLTQTTSGDDNTAGGMVEMISIPDGLELGEKRDELSSINESLVKSIYGGELVALIQRINAKEGERVTCLVVDILLGFSLEVVEKLGIKRAIYGITAAATLAMGLNIPNLINEGVVDQDGNLLKDQMISQLPSVVNSNNFVWSSFEDKAIRKSFFNIGKELRNWTKSADWFICNSSLDLEPDAFSKTPELRPVGPLLSSKRGGRTKGLFWRENDDCLKWLDQQPPNSVIYVAFGSTTIFDQVQFKELASSLELTTRPFLWAVRSESTINVDSSYLEGFKERTQKHGMIVEWAPQQQVLSHPSIACFISHCGWNSIIETIANGVPVLTWPYFADHFLYEDYICDVWKVGLRLKKDKNDIARCGEIKEKVDQLLRDKGFKERIELLQEKSMNSVRKGVSNKNFNSFVKWIKDH